MEEQGPCQHPVPTSLHVRTLPACQGGGCPRRPGPCCLLEPGSLGSPSLPSSRDPARLCSPTLLQTSGYSLCPGAWGPRVASRRCPIPDVPSLGQGMRAAGGSCGGLAQSTAELGWGWGPCGDRQPSPRGGGHSCVGFCRRLPHRPVCVHLCTQATPRPLVPWGADGSVRSSVRGNSPAKLNLKVRGVTPAGDRLVPTRGDRGARWRGSGEACDQGKERPI